ncbi:MAG: hypothetical protein HYZ29_00925 [Myxococcales bacterium]|nr:hypothetical protein [Myxococcales bacterium]
MSQLPTVMLPVRALLEAFVVESQRVLSDTELNDALRLMIKDSMHVFLHPEDSPEFRAGRPFKSQAGAEKLRGLWRLAITKLLTATSFNPSGDLLQTVGLRIADVKRLRNQTEEIASDDDPVDDLFDYVASPPTWDELQHVFRHGGVMRQHIAGYGDCLVLGHVAHGSICRTLEITISDGRVMPFNLLDSVFPTLRHQGSDTVSLIKGIPCVPGARGRCWTSRHGLAPRRIRYFAVRDDGVHWLGADVQPVLSHAEEASVEIEGSS